MMFGQVGILAYAFVSICICSSQASSSLGWTNRREPFVVVKAPIFSGLRGGEVQQVSWQCRYNISSSDKQLWILRLSLNWGKNIGTKYGSVAFDWFRSLAQPTSTDELDVLIQDATQQKLVVVYFYSSDTSSVCEKVTALYQELSEKKDEFTEETVVFVKINADNYPLLASKYQVTGFPTFLFIKNGSVLTEIVGGNLAEATLYDWIKLLMPKPKENE